MKEITIIIPVYNEERLIEKAIREIHSLDINKEIIAIDDASSDSTPGILSALKRKLDFKIVRHLTNRGKGTAILSGLKEATGRWILVFDADLEYSSEDILLLLEEAKKYEGKIAVFGSRFLKKYDNKFSIHYLANKFLTGLANFLFGLSLTDMETCLKLCPADVIKNLELKAKRFEIEPEITAKLAKKKIEILEIPVKYNRRNYKQGKKIRFKDGLAAMKTLIKEFVES